MKTTFAKILADRDIEIELDDDEAILDIVILTRNVKMSGKRGDATIGIYTEDQVDSILSLGMLHSALSVYASSEWEADERD